MKTKYVCRGLINPYVNFQYNQTMWSKNLRVKICRWGERKNLPRISKVTRVTLSGLLIKSSNRA